MNAIRQVFPQSIKENITVKSDAIYIKMKFIFFVSFFFIAILNAIIDKTININQEIISLYMHMLIYFLQNSNVVSQLMFIFARPLVVMTS